MKKLILILALVIGGLTVYAQEDDFNAIHYKEIEKSITNSSSNLYYPNLMERYKMGDSTLTIQEMRHLYYGYVFQPEYIPTDVSEYNGKMVEILSKKIFTAQDYDKVLEYADTLLEEDPFNLRAINAKLLVYAQNNNTDAYKKNAQKRKIIQDAVVSTGDGMSEKTPFYVIKVAHEYDLLGFLGFKFGGEDKVVKNCNYLTLAPNRFGVDKIYFEISPVLKYVTKHGGKL